MSIAISLLLLFFPLYAHALHCIFTPPPKWEFADPSCLGARVKIGFIGKNRLGLRPSLNLAVEEEVSADIDEYLKTIKTAFEKKSSRWRDLGSFTTAAGAARLTSVDMKTEGGEARLLQLILLQSGTAYILTAAASKEEFPSLQKEFENAFRSLNLTDNLLLCLKDPEKQSDWQKERALLETKWQAEAEKFSSAEEHFMEKSFQKAVWLPFQQKILREGEDLGPYGQLLFLQEVQMKLLSLQKVKL